MRRLSMLLPIVLLAALTGCVVTTSEQRPPAVARSAAASANDAVQRSLRDVERFWTAAFPTISGGRAFTPVRGGYHPYTPADPPPACGGQPGEYIPNAFYCPTDDFIAWDAQQLVPQLNQQYGPLLVGVVMAHEYGHAVQARLDQPEQPTVVLEQQADCFAGAWTAEVLDGRSTAFADVGPQQLDNTVAGLLTLRDQPGTSATNPQAHGNAFDRIRAFQEGVERGPTRCAGYRADNLPVTEVPFQTPEDAATGGNLPYAQAVNLLAQDNQTYWSRTYPRLGQGAWEQLRVVPFDGPAPACTTADQVVEGAFYCTDTEFVAFADTALAQPLYQRIGDNAVGALLGSLFARAVQQRRGASVDGRAGQLAVDCLAGTWTGSLLRREASADLTLSPGDLDEAVAALLVLGRANEGAQLTAFERIAAYRSGVLQGLSACTR